MVVRDGGGPGDFGEPVGIVGFAGGIGVEGGFHLSSAEFGKVAVLFGGSHSEVAVLDRYGGVSRILDVGAGHIFEVFTSFRGDNDDTVGSAGAVDCGCGTVLQHIHRSDFIAGDVVDVAHRHTVDDEQRRGACTFVEGGETTDLDIVSGTGRVGGGLYDVETGNLTLKQTHGVCLDAGVEIFALDGSDGAGDLFLLL